VKTVESLAWQQLAVTTERGDGTLS